MFSHARSLRKRAFMGLFFPSYFGYMDAAQILTINGWITDRRTNDIVQ